LALYLADLCLSDAEGARQLDLRQPGCSAYRSKVDHATNTASKEYYLEGMLVRLRALRACRRLQGQPLPGAQAARSQFAHGWVRTIDDTELNCGNSPIADTTR